MKYIKEYEKNINKFPHIYDNIDFFIYINPNGYFTYHSDKPYCESSPIFEMADLIRKKSEYLSDKKLRNIILPIERKKNDLETLKNYKNENRRNIINNRSSHLDYFLGKEINENIPIDIYIELIDKYYPKIIKIIKKSNTIGDIIDEFETIYTEIMSDVQLKVSANKYNL